MNAKLATLLLSAALASSPVLAQAPSNAPAKPSLLSRMKAATQKTTTTKTVSTTVANPATAHTSGQQPRTEKSLACSKQADAKNVHGKDRKSFMSQCKKA